MFLQDLYLLGLSLERQGLLTPVLHQSREVQWVINLKEDGSFVSMSPLSAKHPVASARGYKAATPSSMGLVEEALYIFPPAFLKSKNKDLKPTTHNQDFLSYVEEISKTVPCVQIVLDFYSQTDFSKLGLPEDFDFSKRDLICFKVGEEFLHLRPDVQAACSEAVIRAYSESSKMRGQCCLSGEMDVPIASTHLSVGKNSLINFNETAFEHYGLKQAQNCPTSVRAMVIYTEAAKWLMNNPKHCVKRKFEDSIALWWIVDENGLPLDISHDGVQDVNPFIGLDSLFEEDILEESQAEVKPENIKKALETLTSYGKDRDLDTTRVRFLLLKPRMGRWVPRYSSRTLQEALDRVKEFQKLTTVSSFGKLKTPSLWDLCKAVHPKGNRATSLKTLLSEYLYLGTPFPLYLSGNILSFTQKSDLSGKKLEAEVVSWVRLIMSKKGIDMSNINQDLPYIFGQLFYITQRAHDEAIGASRNVVLKKTIQAQEDPKRIFIELDEIFNMCVQKLESGGKAGHAVNLKKRRSEIMSLWQGRDLPNNFSEDDSFKFVLGRIDEETLRYTKKEVVEEVCSI